MTYEEAMIKARQGNWMTRQAWIDDDLCKQVTKGQDGEIFAESYDIGERYRYKPTEDDKQANDWRWSPV